MNMCTFGSHSFSRAMANILGCTLFMTWASTSGPCLMATVLQVIHRDLKYYTHTHTHTHTPRERERESIRKGRFECRIIRVIRGWLEG